MGTKREVGGQYTKGTGGGPGRPAKAVEQSYLNETMLACTPEKWGGIINRAVDDSTAENPKVRNDARAFLKGVLFGKSDAGVIDQVKQFEPKPDDADLFSLPEFDGDSAQWLADVAGWKAD